MKILLTALLAICTVTCTPFKHFAQTATYDVTNPEVISSGAFTGVLGYNGLRVGPYFTTLRTVNNITRNLDTMNQKIAGAHHSVTTQFTYTQSAGPSYGCVVYTEASIDSGTATGYVTLYTDSVKTAIGAQVFGHYIQGWPYTNIRLRWKGTGVYTGTWKGQLLIR